MNPTLPISENSQKRVGIWIRVSSEDQAQGDSPLHHRKRAEMYCESRSWKVVEVYDLAGVSGKTVFAHPEAQRMMEDIRRGHIQALVFSKLARLTRNVRELMDFADFFQGHGADLVSLAENVDTSSPAGRLFFNIVGSMAQWEREEITDRIKSSVMVRAKLGKPISGKVPYGYQWKDRKLVVHPENAAVRRLIYELFAEHQRIKTVARILNERGYRTHTGKEWSDMAIRWQLKDTTAKGIHRRNYTRSGGTGAGMAYKPESEHVFNEVEAIVSPELWDRCNALLEARYTQRARPAKKPAHLFSGFLMCAECNMKMYVPSKGTKYTCAKCGTKVPCVDLEEVFLEELRGYLVNPENIKKYMDTATTALSETQQLLEARRKESAKLEADTQRMLQLFLENAVSAEDFKKFNQPLSEHRQQVEDEVLTLEAQVSALKVDEISSEQVIAEAADLHARWPKMSLDDRRRMVELIVKRISVGKDTIDLRLTHLPSYKEITNWQNTYPHVNKAERSSRGSGGGRWR